MVFKYLPYGHEALAEVDEDFLTEEVSQEEGFVLTLVDTPDHTAGQILHFPASENLPGNVSAESPPERDEELSVTSQDGTDSTLARYFKSISRFSLLNEEEEITLAMRIKANENMLKDLIIQWDRLFKRDFMRSLPAVQVKEIRKKIYRANGTFSSFDDLINLERERKRLYRTRKKFTHETTAQEDLQEELYKVEAALSKAIAQINFTKPAVDSLIKQVKKLSNGHRKTKRQQQVEWKLGATLRKISRSLHEISNAKNELIKANLRLVISIAKKYAYHGIPLADLIQEGNLGLIRATDTYDYRKGHRFSTYAIWWIRQAVLRMIYCNSRTIRTPVYLREKMNKIAKLSNQLQLERRRKPTLDEIAETTNISLDAIEKVTQSFKESLSLDTFIEDHGEKALNSPPNHTENVIIRQATLSDLAQRIDVSLSILSQRERDVIKLRFGIGESHNHSLREIGKKFKLSRERIRQILDASLRKLKNSTSKNELKDFVGLN